MNHINGSKKIKVTTCLLLITALLIIVSTSGCSQILKPAETSSITEKTLLDSKTTEAVAESTAETTVQQSSTTSTEADKSKEIEIKFNGIDKNAGNIEKIFNFIDKNINSVNQDLAATIVYSVMKLCEDYKFEFTDKFSSQEIQNSILDLSTSGEIDMEKLKNTDNQTLEGLVTEVINKKYKLMMVEGFVMPLVDYQAYDIYRQYLSKEMNDYMDIKLDESNRPSVLDAGIVIPTDDFIQRILKSYNYLENYPDSPRASEVKQFNHGRMQVYLGGIDNNPVFDSNQKILPEKLKEFENNLTKYSGTKFAEILNSFLELLKQESYIRTQKIDEFLSNTEY
jgi:hypothetical protein